MKAVNLYLLTRSHDNILITELLHSLAESPYRKPVSRHEAATLCALADRLAGALTALDSTGQWTSFLDGFFFSYTIEHIGKEFDLLKLSGDESCILNIELKSEDIGEDRIRRQLLQNRYYLSHISRTILSFTYVLESDRLYFMNDRGYLREASVDELIAALRRPALSTCITNNLDELFRSSDYLISPVSEPERFLKGRYFLTNQQETFRRQILEHLEEEPSAVVSLCGIAGTGKTLLLFDLALILSKKKQVLFLHAGPLRKGHRTLDERLHNVTIRAASQNELPLSQYQYIFVDEANRIAPGPLKDLLDTAGLQEIPLILAYDPQTLLGEQGPFRQTEALILSRSTLSLAFSGNIRINRSVYIFLKRLFHQGGTPAHADYGCIEILYAQTGEEEEIITAYYLQKEYLLIAPARDQRKTGSIIAQEYDKVLLVLNEDFYYDESMQLQTRQKDSLPLQVIYESLSRTREQLCVLVSGNQELFSQILKIRSGE